MHRQHKDKQEAAIYVFTTITIIFLPISTVAGIFGMNTQDMRNLESSQWLF
jgi:Mg2+ and Co2+ transporter CorA